MKWRRCSRSSRDAFYRKRRRRSSSGSAGSWTIRTFTALRNGNTPRWTVLVYHLEVLSTYFYYFSNFANTSSTAKTPPNIRYRTPDSPGPDRKVTIPFLAEDQMELEIQQLKADLFNARADLDKARADLDKARADLDKAREDIKSLEECLYQA